MRVALYFLLFVSQVVFSTEKVPQHPPVLNKLPDPISLELALSLADANHPDISSIEYAIEAAKSQTSLAMSKTNLQLRVKARARLIDPPRSLNGFGRQDHAGKFFASQTLYDFGRTGNKVEAKKIREEIAKLRLRQVKQYRRIQIMQAYFDVLLGDLTFLRDNESMTMGFLRYDRAKDRQELGQISEVEVLEKENIYFERRVEKNNSESMQRLLRNQFSIVLNRPENIISHFEAPELKYHEFKLLDVALLHESAEESNLELRIIQLSLEALRAELQSIRSNRYPTISAEAEAGMYKRDIGSNDRWRAGLVFDMPIYQGGKISHQKNEIRMRIKQLENQYYQKKLTIKQQVLNHYLNIEKLASQKESSYKRFDYSELYLDRARAIYEMEVKSDLGDAMVQLSQASLQMAETDFEIAMRWEKLRMLTQMKLEEMRQ